MKSSHRKQLVLQLPGDCLKDYDGLIELEDAIIAGIGNLGEVDGDDMGAGEMNIFIDTDHPKLAFDAIKSLLGTRDFMPHLKAAFRDIGNPVLPL
jgi:hypothetical protein